MCVFSSRDRVHIVEERQGSRKILEVLRGLYFGALTKMDSVLCLLYFCDDKDGRVVLVFFGSVEGLRARRTCFLFDHILLTHFTKYIFSMDK